MGRATGGQSAHAAASRGGRPREWNPERIRRDLRALLAGRTTWPTAAEFQEARREDLRLAVSRYGGAAHWANEFGIELRPEQDKTPYPLERAVADAGSIIDELGHLPGANKLRQLGHTRLAGAVFRHGGAAAFCQRFGLPFDR